MRRLIQHWCPVDVCISLWWFNSCRTDTNTGLHKSIQCYVDLYIQINVYSFKYSILQFYRACRIFHSKNITSGARRCVTALQAGRSRVHSHNTSNHTVILVSTRPLTEMSTRGYRRPVPKADKLTTFVCRLSQPPGALIFWNPQASNRPAQGLCYLYKKR